jgi:hypothetical protein
VNTLRQRRNEVQGTAETWPESPEVDGYSWELGPDPDDARWAADNLNGDDEGHATDGPAPDDPIWDEWAEEAATQDLMERGLRPF